MDNNHNHCDCPLLQKVMTSALKDDVLGHPRASRHTATEPSASALSADQRRRDTLLEASAKQQQPPCGCLSTTCCHVNAVHLKRAIDAAYEVRRQSHGKDPIEYFLS